MCLFFNKKMGLIFDPNYEERYPDDDDKDEKKAD